VKMPFEKLMEHVAALGDEDAALTLGELSKRWGEPAARIGDAINAVQVASGERTYITVGEGSAAHYRRLFELQQQARDLGRGIMTGGGSRGPHHGAVRATYPQGSRHANADSWVCHHEHPDDLSALECALAEVRRLAGGGSYEPCSAGPGCEDEFCRRDWARLTR
jgi:hypothetical protein